MRSREWGALFVPVEIEAEVYTFHLQDGVYEIAYDPKVFDLFPQVRMNFEGRIQHAYDVPHRATKQIKFIPFEMVW